MQWSEGLGLWNGRLVLGILHTVGLAARRILKRIRISDFKSQFVTPRNIDVWLPEDYSKTKKYAVLYMQDGQMLYDPDLTWNKQSWNVEETVAELIKSKKIQNTIVVGIWNDSKVGLASPSRWDIWGISQGNPRDIPGY